MSNTLWETKFFHHIGQIRSWQQFIYQMAASLSSTFLPLSLSFCHFFVGDLPSFSSSSFAMREKEGGGHYLGRKPFGFLCLVKILVLAPLHTKHSLFAEKQIRQVQLCTKAPPSSSKRSFYGGPCNGISNTKSGIMKKAKLEFINSREVKNLAAMKKKVVQRNHSVSSMRKPSGSSSVASSSASRVAKPIQRRF